MMNIQIQLINKTDESWIINLLKNHWFSTKIVSRGKIYNASKLLGFIAWQNNKPVALITYHIENNECEIVTLDSLVERKGIASNLVKRVRKEAVNKKCKRFWAITTNDNKKAVKFYQNQGFKIKAIHKNAMEVSRKLKPSIPLIGIDGIPIKDEIELEINL
ncbi:MAG: GNAT family N-acetyltransferase [Candidatus Levyibacteriota bacterium]